MQVYQTDHQGFFVGTNSADPDPLEPNNWLIPAGCVTAEPPALEDGQRAQWTGDAWVVVEPGPGPGPEPEPTLEELAANVRMERDGLLASSDWVVTVSYERGNPVPQPWVDYRQALRDVPQQAGFPENVIWPEQP